MKIEEQNQHVSPCSVSMEEIYGQYEAMGVFGKRSISLAFMYSAHITIWESFGLECVKHSNW